MFWNYRILQRHENEEGTHLYIVEVYYDDEDHSIIGWTEETDVYSQSVDDLRQTLEWMTGALDKPILKESELLEHVRENDHLTLDEVLDSLGLEREDVETNDHGFRDRTQEVDDMINDPEFSEAIKERRKEMDEWERENENPRWDGPDSP